MGNLSDTQWVKPWVTYAEPTRFDMGCTLTDVRTDVRTDALQDWGEKSSVSNTRTPGDNPEIASLQTAFDQAFDARNWCEVFRIRRLMP